MFSLRSVFILLLVLFIPFLLKYLGAEAYPAVLLPTYTETIEKSEQLILQSTSLFGVDKDGVWKEVDKRAFFDPIPLEHANAILAGNLGLERPATKPETKKTAFYRNLGVCQRKMQTDKDLLQLKEWLKMKLALQHLSTSKIRIVVYNNTVAIKPGLVINKEIKNEKIYLLN